MEYGLGQGDRELAHCARTARQLALPCRIAELLRLADARPAPSLVSPAARQRLATIRDPWPPLAAEAAFECRLEAGAEQVDFEICLRGERERLATALEQSGPREALASAPGWSRVLGFLDAWVDPGSLLHDAVSVAWLEFDAPPGAGEPTPFGVLTLDPERLYADGVAEPAHLRAVLEAGLERLAGGLDPATARALVRCLDELPRSAQVLHAAARPTPEGVVARLVVRMPWRELSGALARLRWPGDLGELHARLERLCPQTLVHSINLDVSATGVGPRVGIEFHHGTSPRRDPRWRTVLDELEASGACAPERRLAVEEWPSDPLECDAPPGMVRLQRELLLKVVHLPDAPLRAKAYLAFGPRLVLGS